MDEHRADQAPFSTRNSRETQCVVTEGWTVLADQIAGFVLKAGLSMVPGNTIFVHETQEKSFLLPESSDRELVNKFWEYWSGLAVHPGSVTNCVTNCDECLRF